ncbi:MAG: sensor histidine kinase [Mangrovibacterium sp.]
MEKKRQYLLENFIYGLIWLIIFAAPLWRMSNDEVFDWSEVYDYWKAALPFIFLFVVNNYLLIPRFLLRKKPWIYCLLTSGFVVLLFANEIGKDLPNDLPPKPPHHSFQPIEHFEEPMGERLGEPTHKPPMLKAKPFRLHVFGDCLLLSLFLVGFNIAIQMLFKSLRDEQQIKELQRHTLQAELDYLKAQINPHFFMNTLNNIHALIDIDTERAKEAVIELSKIMRYVLYDANQSRVELSKEIPFLENYIELMRIRFSDNLDIQTEYPEQVADIFIPPLLLVTLIENAFKHGVGIGKDAFIHAWLSVDEERLVYRVENSISYLKQEPSGVGLDNLYKRLSLLFGKDYVLETTSTPEKYSMKLVIPVGKSN